MATVNATPSGRIYHLDSPGYIIADPSRTGTVIEHQRHAAQFQIEVGKDSVLVQSAVDAAIEEMLFAGGALNLKLLGGPAVNPTTNPNT